MPAAARTNLLRFVALSGAIAVAAMAVWLFAQLPRSGVRWLDTTRLILTFIITFWLAWGAMLGLVGLFARRRSGLEALAQPRGATVILVPVYNEDPAAVCARIAVMSKGLSELGLHERFHFAVLSDTTALDVAVAERLWFERLLEETGGRGRIFYRRRNDNAGRKAGNIENFITHSGSAYDYAIMLDADSLIAPETLVRMALRMDADPRLGLLQTLPQLVFANSLFGRIIEFSSGYFGQTFARGLSVLQGLEGPFWGHNAIVRIPAFAQSCGLPHLAGKPPFGGHILSHDYVEAALLARNGWTVRLDTDLEASFEEGPQNLIAFAKRDRRWCQGNLQHHRVLLATGLHWWSRFTLLQGISSYLIAPLWVTLFVLNLLAAGLPRRNPSISYLHHADAATVLAVLVVALLLFAKFLVFFAGMLDGTNRQFGGNGRSALTLVVEVVFSSIMAPIMLLLQTRSVLQVLLGRDGGWPATQRNENAVSMRYAWACTGWIVLSGGLLLMCVLLVSPRLVFWVLPVILPLALAPWFTVWTSIDQRLLSPLLVATERQPGASPILARYQALLDHWVVEPVGLQPSFADTELVEPLRVNAGAVRS